MKNKKRVQVWYLWSLLICVYRHWARVSGDITVTTLMLSRRQTTWGDYRHTFFFFHEWESKCVSRPHTWFLFFIFPHAISIFIYLKMIFLSFLFIIFFIYYDYLIPFFSPWSTSVQIFAIKYLGPEEPVPLSYTRI